MKNLILFLPALCFVIFQSCKQSDLTGSENPSVDAQARLNLAKWNQNVIDETIGEVPKLVDGILHFKNAESYLKTKEELSKKSLKERL
jgi:hypothetical protein